MRGACAGVVLPVTDQPSPSSLREISSASAAGPWGFPLATGDGLMIWQTVGVVWFHGIHK